MKNKCLICNSKSTWKGRARIDNKTINYALCKTCSTLPDVFEQVKDALSPASVGIGEVDESR